ncbi:unnamed protein product [Didymodactylos carnosus]|uniref:Uncharacterized protein n=1 Tax=Didymodactylos carnosus TaxID=1234261 RepID=A0A814RZ33_9BILA|nr:unnamed protein product [Didymodactylos carnosus]CAF1140960.1 unnamed protein product [Didymodactylos carnosus]CAF3663649.1 unnamed protein product [Didymodactylos carnosus]CAF3904667.1 unnamed protein product [Didymodactylos carnosus]
MNRHNSRTVLNTNKLTQSGVQSLVEQKSHSLVLKIEKNGVMLENNIHYGYNGTTKIMYNMIRNGKPGMLSSQFHLPPYNYYSLYCSKTFVNVINKHLQKTQSNRYQNNRHLHSYVHKTPRNKYLSNSKYNDSTDVMYKTESYLKHRDSIKYYQQSIYSGSSDDDDDDDVDDDGSGDDDEDKVFPCFTRNINNPTKEDDELERTLSSVESIHASLNKCLLLSYDKVFPFQYSDNNNLMGLFCANNHSEYRSDDDDSSVTSQIDKQNDLTTQMSSLFENRFSDTDNDELDCDDTVHQEQDDQLQWHHNYQNNDEDLKTLLNDYLVEDKQNLTKLEKRHGDGCDSGYSSQNFSIYNHIENEPEIEANKPPSRSRTSACSPRRQYPFKKLKYTRMSLEEITQRLRITNANKFSKQMTVD